MDTFDNFPDHVEDPDCAAPEMTAPPEMTADDISSQARLAPLGTADVAMDPQYLDQDGDGLVDTIVVPNADATTSVFTDQDRSGVFEAATVIDAQGVPVVVFQDVDENGAYETAVIDQNGNRVFDTVASDTTGDGVLDTVVADVDENGVDDSQEVVTGPGAGGPATSGTFVGPVTNPDPMYDLIIRLADETGMVAMPPSDRDGDLMPDEDDFHPGDPDRW